MSGLTTDYVAYLASDDWQQRRKACLKRDRYRCTACYGIGLVDAHHLSYDNFGHEPLSDLTTLCRDCHDRLHERVRAGAGYIDNPLGALFQERAPFVVAREAPQRQTFHHQAEIERSRERLRRRKQFDPAPEDLERTAAMCAVLGIKPPSS